MLPETDFLGNLIKKLVLGTMLVKNLFEVEVDIVFVVVDVPKLHQFREENPKSLPVFAGRVVNRAVFAAEWLQTSINLQAGLHSFELELKLVEFGLKRLETSL